MQEEGMHEHLIRVGRRRVRRTGVMGYLVLTGTACIFLFPMVAGIFSALQLVGAHWGGGTTYWRTVAITTVVLAASGSLVTVFTSLASIERLAIQGAGGWPRPHRDSPRPPRLEVSYVDRVQSIVDILSLAIGTTPPKVAVTVDPAPNCLTVGRKPETAWILVTSGLVEECSRRELEAVLAYELARVQDWSVSLDTVVYATTAKVFTIWAAAFDDLDHQQIFLIPIAILSTPFIALAWWLRASVLRRRAQLADGLAIRTTRNPRPLLGAMNLILHHPEVVRRGDPGGAHLWFEYPHTGWSRRLLRSHNILPARIRRMERLLQQRPDSTP